MNGETNSQALLALGLYFLIMLAIGLYAWRRSSSNMSEYMLGGRQLSPAVGALSAGASDMSGWLLMGLPGAVYVSGVKEAWIGIGLVIGAYLNYKILAPRLRVFTEMADDALTIPDYLEKRFDDNSHKLRMVSAFVIIIFFTLYTSSGVVAGGKLFEASFGLDYTVGSLLTLAVVLTYTMFGGFLAVSLTDFVQGVIMFLALIIVPIAALDVIGGWDQARAITLSVNPDEFNWIKGTTTLGIISSLAWGLGYFGQPHIIVRFMAIRDLKGIKHARWIGMSWMIISLIGSILIGIAGLAYVTKTGTDLADPETIFILLSQLLFHPFIAGFLLAAILAAIMSTISSQLLVSSSSLTEDIYKLFLNKNASQKQLVRVGRLCVLAVSVVAFILALDRSNNILSLVSNAWAGFGAAFGPVLLLSLYWRNMTRQGALAGMLAGAGTVLLWLYLPITIGGQSLSGWLYEMVPGFTAAALTAVLVSRHGAPAHPSLKDRFDKMVKAMEHEEFIL